MLKGANIIPRSLAFLFFHFVLTVSLIPSIIKPKYSFYMIFISFISLFEIIKVNPGHCPSIFLGIFAEAAEAAAIKPSVIIIFLLRNNHFHNKTN